MIKTIGFVSENNPFEDRKAWSGTFLKMREAIECAGFQVLWIPCKLNKNKERQLKLYYKLLYGRNTRISHTKACVKAMVKSMNSSLLDKCDALFTQWCGLPHYLKFKTEVPCIHLADGTFKLMENYYWFNLNKHVSHEANELEYLGIQAARVNIRASKWAADSTINDYGGDPAHTYVLEFGANIDDRDITHISTFGGGKLRILFSGVDWKRKGAETAIRTVDLLNEHGIDAEFTMVGIKEVPTEYQNHPKVRYMGFLNKNIPEEYNKYIEIVKQSHILLLPTRAECAGIVFSEAAAYGMPVFTYLTGGTGDYVRDGINGYALQLSEGPEGFAKAIEENLSPERQKVLHEGALRMYDERLSWKAWSQRFKEIVEKELG